MGQLDTHFVNFQSKEPEVFTELSKHIHDQCVRQINYNLHNFSKNAFNIKTLILEFRIQLYSTTFIK